MARALLVGCGCRGRQVGRRLADAGWAVRGTARSPEGVAAISEAGIEGVIADPDFVGTVLDHVGDVTVVAWLMGSATGTREELVELNEHRLGSLLEKLVDSPVRGFVLEGAGSVPDDILASAVELVEDASRRWNIPVRVVAADPSDHERWVEAMCAAIGGVLES